MSNWLLLLLVSALTCAGQLCQKQAARHWHPQLTIIRNILMLRWMLTAVFLLVLAMVLWLRLLQYLPLSVAYPMLSLNLVLVTFSARIFFAETTSLRHWIGIFCVISGIFLISSAA